MFRSPQHHNRKYSCPPSSNNHEPKPRKTNRNTNSDRLYGRLLSACFTAPISHGYVFLLYNVQNWRAELNHNWRSWMGSGYKRWMIDRQILQGRYEGFNAFTIWLFDSEKAENSCDHSPNKWQTMCTVELCLKWNKRNTICVRCAERLRRSMPGSDLECHGEHMPPRFEEGVFEIYSSRICRLS